MSIEWHREADDGLLPCPFCGSPAMAWRVYLTRVSLPWQIECSNYECGIGTHGYETRAEAAYVWNRRVGNVEA